MFISVNNRDYPNKKSIHIITVQMFWNSESWHSIFLLLMPRFVGIIWSHSWLMYQFVWLKSLFSLCLYSDHPFTRQCRQGLVVMSSLSLPDIVNVCVFIYDLRSILIISPRGLVRPIKLFQLRHLLLKHLYPARKMHVYLC
jgi:hypothetical protein